MATGSRTKIRISKAEQSRATRQRIVAAATTLFLRDGFLTATMSAIAKETGVAVQTLYLSFTNKTAILSAAFDSAVAGDDEPIPIVERDWYKTLTTDPSGPV
jgi:AcrR family transcriptional regulator